MEAILTAIVVAILFYFLYEAVTWIHAAKYPTPPYEGADPVLGKVATVCRAFSDARSSNVRTGAVELNGTTWEAETYNTEQVLIVGDRCKISGRDGLRLLIEPEF
ncbi:MAG: NfeD family protein [Woeseiaceae bacterium]